MNREQLIEKAYNFLCQVFHSMPEMLDKLKEIKETQDIRLLRTFMASVTTTSYKMTCELDDLLQEESSERKKGQLTQPIDN